MMPETLTAKLENNITLCADYFAALGTPKRKCLVCLPGGGASKDYFDLMPDYSFVAKMRARGYALIVMNHPGIETNPLPNTHPFLTPRQAADYTAHALAVFKGMPQIKGDTFIGIGHSMGGMTMTLIQGRHRPYAALALFGSSAGGLEWGLDDHEMTFIDRPEALAVELETLTLRKFKTPFPKGTGGPSGKSITFGGETEAVTQRLRETSCALFAAGGLMSMTRGSFKTEVEAIDVPIFFAFGDHDIGIPPKDVPQDYINSPTHELITLDNTGHNSFAFSSLEKLCQRLDHWLSSQDC